MYEKLIQALRCCADDNIPCANCPRQAKCIEERNMNGLFPEAADAIEELSHEIDIDNAAMTAMDAAMPRWIPVTGEAPLEVGDDGYNGYLVYVNGYYAIADYAKDKYDNVPYFHVDGEMKPDVTHYIPLPPPPKEET